MNDQRFACLLSLLSVLSAPFAAEPEESVTLSGGEWPPFISEGLPGNGPVARVVTEAFALEGVKVNYLFRPWNRAYAEAVNGVTHGTLVWSLSGKETDRTRRFHASAVLFYGQSVFFHRKNFPFTWRGERTLAGLRMGGTAGYEYFFDRSALLNIDKSASSDAQNFHKLLGGRFDVFPLNLDVGLSLMRTELSPEQASTLTWDPRPYNIAHYHILFNRKNPANQRYVALFDRGLKKLRDSGKYGQIMQGFKQDGK
nr:hypothetical protein [uncultured Duganella sp.]